ncbi:hypothetical protein ACQJBY_072688 [Aegilops geniculata]
MAHNFVPDAWGWISSLPPFSQWRANTMSLCICATPSASASSQPTSMTLSVAKTPPTQPSHLTFSISANYREPIFLWTSKPVHLKTKAQQSLDEQDMVQLFADIVNQVLWYGPDNSSKPSFQFPGAQHLHGGSFSDAFNIVFLSLAFLVCIYEAPRDLRRGCLDSLRTQLTSPKCRGAAKTLVKMLGANLEDQWMQTMNLAQLEGVVQLAYKTVRRDNWIDIEVKVDNIRCDVDPLVSETLMAERGYGSEEKHFPSRVMLQITPMQQTDVLSVSVSKSSDNPTHEFGIEKGFEGSFDPPNSFGLKASVAESLTLAMKPWKFEQSVHGNTATLNWFLHDGMNGREVCASKPSKLSLLQPRAWFRDRYSNAYRPFTKQGGIIFARDEYGDSVNWKVCGAALGKTMDWEIRGWIWLTYWPNKQRTSHSETRWLEFRECLQLPLTKLP